MIIPNPQREANRSSNQPCGSFLPQPQTVLMVLSQRELNGFFPDFSLGGGNSASSCRAWLDSQELSAERWAEALNHYRPTVLVTAWSTPQIPEAWALEPGSPLRYVCHITGSIRHVVSRALIAHGVTATNWGSLISYTIAEHAMLLLLGALRGAPLWRENLGLRKPEVQKNLQSRSLRGKRVGLHGFGAIARELVGMLQPHQVELFSYSAPVPRAFIEKYGVTYCASLDELFSRSDIIIECEGLTPTSRGAVTEDILRLLPENAVFVNVGRAGVTDEAALIRMARENRLRVAVDVYGQEPLPKSSPWHGVSNAFLSPHIAGPTLDVYPACGQRAMENVERFLRGEPVQNPITLTIYDMST